MFFILYYKWVRYRSEERGCEILKCMILNNQEGDCDSKVNEVGV